MTTGALAHGARGGATIITGQFAKIGLQLVGVSVLSRLLPPEDFGLVAMVAVFLAAGDLIRDFGIPTAALQAKTLSHQQASNVFWVCSTLGALSALVIAGLTPVLVAIYDEPRLQAVVPVMAITLLINGLQAQSQVQLARSLRFASLSATDVAAQFIGLGAAILGALAGWGYWALVAQLVVTATALLVLRGVAARWYPTRPRRGHGSAPMLRAGSEFGLAQFLTFAANNVDSLVIGRRWGASELGTYNRAFQLYMLPRAGILDPLTRVVIPTLNAAASEGRRSTDVLLRLQFTLSALLTWIYLVLAVTADWLIPFVLGDQWTGSVEVFRALAVGGCFAAFGTVSYWTFIVENQSRQLLYLHLVTKPIGVLLVVAAAPIGVSAVALAYSLGLAIAWPINLIWLARCSSQDSWAFFRVGMRVVGAAASGYVIARCGASIIGDAASLSNALVGAGIATGVYVLALAAVPGGWKQISAAYRVVGAVVSRQRALT